MLAISCSKQREYHTQRAVRVSRCQLLTFQLEHYPLILSQRPGPLRVVEAVTIVSCFSTFFSKLVPYPIDYRLGCTRV